MPLVVFGLNHKSAPLKTLGRIVVAEDLLPRALSNLSAKTDATESVILSTCNRFEIYGLFQHDDAHNALAEWLSAYRGVPRSEIDAHCFSYAGAAAAHHLMRVSSSIDSMIVGEAQILGQVKSAYRIALDEKTTGPTLSRLFENSIALAKQIRTSTALGKYPVSYAPALVKTCHRLFESLADKNVLLIGTGEMIELAATHFSSQDIARMSIAGRSIEKARAMAERFSSAAIELEAIHETLHHQDIVVSCTASTDLILHAAEVLAALKKRKRKPMLLIDMALPRDMDERIKELADAYFYTLEDLAEIIDENQQARLVAARQAEVMIKSKVGEYVAWVNARKSKRVVTDLLAEAEDVRKQALEKSLKALRKGKPAEEALSELAASLTGKLLHPVLKSLSQASESQEGESSDTLEKQLDNETK